MNVSSLIIIIILLAKVNILYYINKFIKNIPHLSFKSNSTFSLPHFLQT